MIMKDKFIKFLFGDSKHQLKYGILGSMLGGISAGYYFHDKDEIYPRRRNKDRDSNVLIGMCCGFGAGMFPIMPVTITGVYGVYKFNTKIAYLLTENNNEK